MIYLIAGLETLNNVNGNYRNRTQLGPYGRPPRPPYGRQPRPPTGWNVGGRYERNFTYPGTWNRTQPGNWNRTQPGNWNSSRFDGRRNGNGRFGWRV